MTVYQECADMGDRCRELEYSEQDASKVLFAYTEGRPEVFETDENNWAPADVFWNAYLYGGVSSQP